MGSGRLLGVPVTYDCKTCGKFSCSCEDGGKGCACHEGRLCTFAHDPAKCSCAQCTSEKSCDGSCEPMCAWCNARADEAAERRGYDG